VVEELARLRLAVEAVDVVLVAAEGLVEHLEGDLAVVAAVVAEVHGAHAALAEPAEDAVVAEGAQLERVRRGGAGGGGTDRCWWGGPGPGVVGGGAGSAGTWFAGRARGRRSGRVQVGLFHVPSCVSNPLFPSFWGARHGVGGTVEAVPKLGS